MQVLPSECHWERDESTVLFDVEELCARLRIVQHNSASVIDPYQDVPGGGGASTGINSEELPFVACQESAVLKVWAEADTSLATDLPIGRFDAAKILGNIGACRNQFSTFHAIQKRTYTVDAVSQRTRGVKWCF
jgi:hypothetical protein